MHIEEQISLRENTSATNNVNLQAVLNSSTDKAIQDILLEHGIPVATLR